MALPVDEDIGRSLLVLNLRQIGDELREVPSVGDVPGSNKSALPELRQSAETLREETE